MSEKAATMLMFDGVAYDAMQLYVNTFKDAKITHMERYGTGQAGQAGSIKIAQFEINGQRFMCFDSPTKYDFRFSPAMSIFIDFEHADDLKRAYAKLSDQGQVMMQLGHHGFSTLFGWIADRYGVNWQLNLK